MEEQTRTDETQDMEDWCDESTETAPAAAAAATAAAVTAEAGKETAAHRVKRKERRLSEFQRFALQAFAFFLILYILFAHIVGLMTMPNGDMYPRIDGGDLLLYYRLDKDPKAQDIVVFYANNTRYVARVIAVGGDTVEITDEGSVLVNGNSVIESNIFYETYRLEGFTSYPLTLDKDQCFVLADGRRGSEDSRFFGPVKYGDLIGTVISIMRRNNL